MTDTELAPMSRPAASEAVTDAGWRLLFESLATAVAVASTAEALELCGHLADQLGEDFDAHLRADLRPGRVELTLQSVAAGTVTTRDAALAIEISTAVSAMGLSTRPATGGQRTGQTVELCIDAMDIAAIRPFWRAVLGYVDWQESLADPLRQGPSVWFQQMDQPREQRNRIHFDLSVPHDEADKRIAAAIDAGGVLVSAAEAPAFWILADAEGNEICVCTWQGRD